MRERARVSSIDGTLVRVYVGLSCDKSCAYCTRTEAGRFFEAINPKRFELAPGDDVEVYVAPHRAVWEGMLLFILPLVLFSIGYACANLVFRASDTVGFIAGCSGIGLGFVINYLRLRVLGRKNLPAIVGKLSSN